MVDTSTLPGLLTRLLAGLNACHVKLRQLVIDLRHILALLFLMILLRLRPAPILQGSLGPRRPRRGRLTVGNLEHPQIRLILLALPRLKISSLYLNQFCLLLLSPMKFDRFFLEVDHKLLACVARALNICMIIELELVGGRGGPVATGSWLFRLVSFRHLYHAYGMLYLRCIP